LDEWTSEYCHHNHNHSVYLSKHQLNHQPSLEIQNSPNKSQNTNIILITYHSGIHNWMFYYLWIKESSNQDWYSFQYWIWVDSTIHRSIITSDHLNILIICRFIDLYQSTSIDTFWDQNQNSLFLLLDSIFIWFVDLQQSNLNIISFQKPKYRLILFCIFV